LNEKSFNVVAKSGYGVSETVPPGWIQDSATCSNGSPLDNISVGANETVTCTFVNKAFTLGLTPQSAANLPGTQHCVTANVKLGGVPSQNQPVRFKVSGLHQTTGGPTQTDASGNAPFCYTSPGAGEEGDDSIRAWVDVNGNGFYESYLNEPSDTAVKCWSSDLRCGNVRPKAATPVRAALVLAYTACGAPNSTHGGGISAPSCTSPSQASNYLTVGTADSNGKTTNSVSSVRMDVYTGNPGTPQDDADVKFTVSITDVRKKGDLSDYTGEVRVVPTFTMTDKYNGDSLREHATTLEQQFPITVPCTATPDTTTGSTCAVMTFADALVPGAVPEGRRSNWELGQVKVYDGGADDRAFTTGDNTLFETQGVFVP
jgi:hypothetical protein